MKAKSFGILSSLLGILIIMFGTYLGSINVAPWGLYYWIFMSGGALTFFCGTDLLVSPPK